MMKKNILMSAIIIGLPFASCKKETIVAYTSNSVVAGFYIGKYGGTAPSFYLSALLRSNGTCRFYTDGTDTTNSDKAEGLYNFNDGKLLARFRYLVNPFTEYSMAATLSGNTFTGTWGPGSLTSGTVVITLTRQ
jgi:hypothetical protein